jgi:transposase
VDPVRGDTDRQDTPAFVATYQAITRRRGKKIVTTAVARKLLTRAYHLLTDAENAPRQRKP